MNPKQFLMIVTGPSMHGKTTVSKLLAEGLQVSHIDIDAMRVNYFPNILAEGGVRDRSGDFFLEGDAEVSTACHYYAANEIRRKISEGESVVFSGATSRDVMKAPLIDMMRDLSCRKLVVKIAGQLEECEIENRIRKRLEEGSHSPVVSSEVYHKIRLSQTEWPWMPDVYEYHKSDVNISMEELVCLIAALI